MNRADLIAAVEARFESTARGMQRWPNPHPFGAGPEDDEYSRVTNPERYRIVGARCEAWLGVLTERGLCSVERDVAVTWETSPPTTIRRVDRAMPLGEGALPLVVARTSIDELEDFGVTLGVGDPAAWVASLPNCGCDACDDGSQYELDEVDRKIFALVSGVFRCLTRKGRQITVEDGGWSASGKFRHGEVEAILADPKGWIEVSGVPWGGGG